MLQCDFDYEIFSVCVCVCVCVIIIIGSSIVVILLVSRQRPSILQVRLCILCNYKKYLYISSISGCLYLWHPTPKTPMTSHTQNTFGMILPADSCILNFLGGEKTYCTTYYWLCHHNSCISFTYYFTAYILRSSSGKIWHILYPSQTLSHDRVSSHTVHLTYKGFLLVSCSLSTLH
jgi:hypothetical protein